jgi:hypothetical protein
MMEMTDVSRKPQKGPYAPLEVEDEEQGLPRDVRPQKPGWRRIGLASVLHPELFLYNFKKNEFQLYSQSFHVQELQLTILYLMLVVGF